MSQFVEHAGKKAILLYSDDKSDRHYLFYLNDSANKKKVVIISKEKIKESVHAGVVVSDKEQKQEHEHEHEHDKLMTVGGHMITKERNQKEVRAAKNIIKMNPQQLVALEMDVGMKVGNKVKFDDALEIAEKMDDEMLNKYSRLAEGVEYLTEDEDIEDGLEDLPPEVAAKFRRLKGMSSKEEIDEANRLLIGDVIVAEYPNKRLYAARVQKITFASGMSIKVKPPTEYAVAGSPPKIERRAIPSKEIHVKVMPLHIAAERTIMYNYGEKVPLATIVEGKANIVPISSPSDAIRPPVPGQLFVVLPGETKDEVYKSYKEKKGMDYAYDGKMEFNDALRERIIKSLEGGATPESIIEAMRKVTGHISRKIKEFIDKQAEEQRQKNLQDLVMGHLRRGMTSDEIISHYQKLDYDLSYIEEIKNAIRRVLGKYLKSVSEVPLHKLEQEAIRRQEKEKKGI